MNNFRLVVIALPFRMLSPKNLTVILIIDHPLTLCGDRSRSFELVKKSIILTHWLALSSLVQLLC